MDHLTHNPHLRQQAFPSEHPVFHTTATMNDATLFGIIFVIIFTILGLAAVIWALSKQDRPDDSGKVLVRRGRRRRNETPRPVVPGHSEFQMPSNASSGLRSDVRRNLEGGV